MALTANHSVSSYRPDIDGLRALAVLSVFAYHLNITSIAPGGYVGVDVFFVISGYLITKIIIPEVSGGKYDFSKFYARRAARLIPAAIPVYLFCIIFSFFSRLEFELTDVVKTAISSIAMASNIRFWMNSGYFDGGLEDNPLLHTWSLSVEEQFYLIFPIILIAASRFGRRAREFAICALLAASFLGACIWVFKRPSDAFYLVHFRAWELMAGALLAAINPNALTQRWQSEALSFLGLALIASAVFFYTPETTFPGLSALAPVGGAIALLYAGQNRDTVVHHVLALPPVRFIGLISYSLYLWHWPLIVFYRQYWDLVPLAKVGLLLSGIAIAYLSWRVFEQPFRKAAGEQPYHRTLWLAGGSLLTVCAAAGASLLAYPALRSTPPGVEQFIAYVGDNYDPAKSMRTGSCFIDSSSGREASVGRHCLALSKTKKNVLIVGDSYAAHLWSGLSMANPDLNFLQATASGCKPTLPIDGRSHCVSIINEVFSSFVKENRVDSVVLAAKWRQEDVEPALRAAMHVSEFADHVVIIGLPPEYDRPLARILAEGGSDRATREARVHQHLQPTAAVVDVAFRRRVAGKSEKIRFVSIYENLCQERCITVLPNGDPIQFDRGHFTEAGSLYVGQKLRGSIQ